MTLLLYALLYFNVFKLILDINSYFIDQMVNSYKNVKTSITNFKIKLKSKREEKQLEINKMEEPETNKKI